MSGKNESGTSWCSPSDQHQIDFIQAQLMLDLLKDASAGEIDPIQVDVILETTGMHLIIEQQNVRGKINTSQYKVLLIRLNGDHLLDI